MVRVLPGYDCQSYQTQSQQMQTKLGVPLLPDQWWYIEDVKDLREELQWMLVQQNRLILKRTV